ncbi:MAG TPA: hypothetical protein VF533_00070, partial [Solirubrobacteraceae bacterium]
MTRTSLAAAALVLLFAAPAGADTHVDARLGAPETRLSVVADAGDANRVVVEAVNGGLHVRDVVPVRPEGECRRIDDFTARCPIPDEATVDLSDGDDTAVIGDLG